MTDGPVNPSRRLTDDASPSAARRDLVLVKNGRRYMFACAPGEEAALLRRLGEMADDPNIDLNWFDAAMLSHQLGHRLGQRLEQVRKP